MLVRRFAGKERSVHAIALFVLLLVAIAISAQAIHFHSQTEAASATHCLLCEIGGIPLPVLAIVLESSQDLRTVVELTAIAVTQRSAEGSNLAVRPPPPHFKLA